MMKLTFLLFACAFSSSKFSATEGCRAPGEFFQGVSCESCCEQRASDCFEKSGDMWYNSARVIGGECSDLCPKCAPCTARDEETLLSLTPPPSCNPAQCATMDIGIDPCFAMGSCECFCDTANHLVRTCPQVQPTWLTTDSAPLPNISINTPQTYSTQAGTDAIQTSLTQSTECTVDIARANPECPVASCAISEAMKTSCPTGSMKLVDEVAENESECCLKMCNYQCVDSGKGVLAEGDVCCDSNNDPTCNSTCDDGLICKALDEEAVPICIIDVDQVETVTWTIEGPWDMKSIQSESPSLVSIFSQTLGVSPFSTTLSINRFQGIVQAAFTTTAPIGLLKSLNDLMFKPRLQANIIQANPDLATSMFLNMKEVQALYVLEGPWSISAVQDFEEDLKSQFAFALRMNPDQIEEEITTQNKLVQVIYKCKGTPHEIAPLYDATAFTSKFREQIIRTNPGLSQVIGVAACPATQPLVGSSCIGRQTCEYGEECCCGNCFPSMIFMCDDGKWEAMFSDACEGPAAFNCIDHTLHAELAHSPGILQSSKTETEPASSANRVHLHFTLLIIIFAVVLGITSGFICHRCKKEIPSENDLANDLTCYQDFSLDAHDFAGSV